MGLVGEISAFYKKKVVVKLLCFVDFLSFCKISFCDISVYLDSTASMEEKSRKICGDLDVFLQKHGKSINS